MLCSGRAEMQSSPRGRCACETPLVCRVPTTASSSLIQAELRVSEMLAGMTTVARLIGARARKTLSTAYLSRAKTLGLTSFTKRPNLPQMVDFILSRHGAEFAASRNLASTQEWFGLLRTFSRDKSRSAVPAAYAIVASALFDNVDHLILELCRAKDELGRRDCYAPD